MWCGRRESNPYDQRSRDFKSLASTNSATSAGRDFKHLGQYKSSLVGGIGIGLVPMGRGYRSAAAVIAGSIAVGAP